MSGLSPSHQCQPHRLSHSHLATSGTRTLGDYEREILELRTAMQALQTKLGEAERKLQEKKKKGAEEEDNEEDDEDDDEARMRKAINRLSIEENKLREQAGKSSVVVTTRGTCCQDGGVRVVVQQEQEGLQDGRMVGALLDTLQSTSI